MSMHLESPALNSNGRRKGKVKFRNATEARRARELAADWKALQQKWGVEVEEKKRKRALSAEPLVYSLSPPPGRDTKHIKSLDTGHFGPVSSKPIPQYTGDQLLGIAVQHKSCLQPIFSQSAAEDSAKMRR